MVGISEESSTDSSDSVSRDSFSLYTERNCSDEERQDEEDPDTPIAAKKKRKNHK